jgi:hypothetical protein
VTRLAPFTGDDDGWDALVDRLGATTLYPYSAWARFKNGEGWSALRLADGERCAVQLLVKRAAPYVVIAWAPGSPLGDPSVCTAREVTSAVRYAHRGVVHYVRLGATFAATDGAHDLMRGAGWRVVDHPLSSGKSLIHDLDGDEDARVARCSSNWSRNLRRGRSRENVTSVWTSPDAHEIAALHDELQNYKGEHVVDWRARPDRIAALVREFGSRLVVVQCRDNDGVFHAVRGAVVCSGHAYDIIAASSIEGRRRYSSHVTLWELQTELARRGITDFDMGGVDPVNNKGVYDFKHGIGARDVDYLGEWDTASPAILRGILGRIVASRTA